jgi:hypothetical protein
MAQYEKELTVLAGDAEDTRVQLVQVGEAGETPTLEMRMQRYGCELGWRTHRRIRLAPGQIGDLQDALNLMDPDAREADASREGESPFLRVVSDDGAQKQSG